jgi:Divergent InlB B-repeat domain
VIDLVALPALGSVLASWGGACAGAAAICTIVVTKPTSVGAVLELREGAEPRSLTVERVGGGVVTSDPPGIVCGRACTNAFSDGRSVTLHADPEPGFQFVGWAGDCTESPCRISMSGNRRVRAEFRRTYSLSVTSEAHIVSVPRGIDCGPVCANRFLAGSLVILTSDPNGRPVTSWAGRCRGNAPACLLTIDANMQVVALSEGGMPTGVRVTVSGEGAVSSVPVGIACPPTCSAEFATGTTLALRAAAAPGAWFRGWGGTCFDVDPSCTVATGGVDFALASFRGTSRLKVEVSDESGTDAEVRSSPPGIVCGSDCSASFPSGTLVELFSPAGVVWDGACERTAPRCLVRMDGDTTVGAQPQAPVSVPAGYASTAAKRSRAAYGINVSVSGNGIVTSSPGGIRCGRRARPCSWAFEPGVKVAFTARRAGRSSAFVRWGGDCPRMRRHVCRVSAPTPGLGVSAAFSRP